ncbi:peptidylprolyl isomerase [Psychrobacter sp. F1192]|uniref:peptidylprolyl isomerase n=1 Tax=Psychrobacter coccoides TaxID=2818440 RepID=A0ABS3NME7_9GAMM|nr:peptidylprolyl isomerase [Psychrobacter coccoides]MBO1530584.1 peptidylprolyl isomerase [Psychrobacter coccoides]
MTVSTYNPADHTTNNAHGNNHHHHVAHHSAATSRIPMSHDEDIVRVMPTLADLKKPHSDKAFIEKAMAEERSNHSNLIASSRDELPSVSVNGVMIDRTAIAQELQYHPAENKEDAVFLATQALVVRELLRLAVLNEPSLGTTAWDNDEEQAISALIEKNVTATTPDMATCERYYQQNMADYKTDPIMSVRHILLACLPEDGDERLTLKKSAYALIEQIKNDTNPNAAFIQLAQQHSACPSKEQGGELGVVNKGQTVPEFENTLFKLEAGLAPSPIESRYGFHIVEVLDKKPGVQMTYEQVSPAIHNKLSQQAFHQSLCDYLFMLADEADIEGIEMTLEQENVFRG